MQEMQETRVRFLSLKESPEKEMAMRSSSFASEIPWAEEPRGVQSRGHRVRHRVTEQKTPVKCEDSPVHMDLVDMEWTRNLKH